MSVNMWNNKFDTWKDNKFACYKLLHELSANVSNSFDVELFSARSFDFDLSVCV